jgi:hypothetical protein
VFLRADLQYSDEEDVGTCNGDRYYLNALVCCGIDQRITGSGFNGFKEFGEKRLDHYR